MRSAMPTKVAKAGYLVMSGLLCFLGALVICDPEASIRTIGALCGLTMLAFGAVKLVGYFSKDLFRLAFENDLSSGILMLALGVMGFSRCRSRRTRARLASGSGGF